MVAKLNQLEEKVEGLTNYIEDKVADHEFMDELNNRLDEEGILDAVRSEHGDGEVTYKGLDPDNDYADVAQDIITRLNDRYRSIPVEEFNDTETDICTTIQAMHDKAQDALSEWRREK